MLVSVIIPALNEAQHIRQAIAAARRDYTLDQVEIIVVDSGSTDSTIALIPSSVTLCHSPPGRCR
jgi:glycosyltransferase involved in cell wall biosynthesis